MHVESVAWVAERKDVLYGLFYLLGLISYIKYVDINSRKNYYLCILWFIFSLLSKPAAVVFPLTLFTLDLFRRRKLSLKLIIEKAPFFILAVTIGLLTYYFQAKNGSTELNNSFSIKEQFFFGFYGFMIYFIKFILPFNLAPFYPFPSSNESLPVLFYLSPLFFILVTVLCILKFKKSNVFAFGFSFYFINLLLVLQFYIVGFAIIADRYTYIPYIGLFYMTGWLIDKWKGPYLTRAIGYILIPGIIFSILTYNQSSKWENSTLLWDYSLKVQPSYKAYISLGMALQDDGNLERAKFCYDEIIKLYPDSSDAYFNRGTLLANEGKYTEALLDYDKCAKLKPDYSIVYYNRGNLKAALNKDSEAYNDLSHSIMLQPDFAEAYINRGIILAKKEKYDEALKDYNQGLKIKPDFYLAYYNRAKLLQATFRYKESIDDFTKTISLKNDYAPAYFDRGIIQCNNGIKDAGCADLQHSISLGFQQAVEVYNRLCK